MSLKYRLILLTIAVFAVTFGAGTLLGVFGARRAAAGELQERLARSARALAASEVPLNREVLDRVGPLLDARVLVLGLDLRAIAHGSAAWPWEQIRAEAARALVRRDASGLLAAGGGKGYYYGLAHGRMASTGEPIAVLTLAPESQAGEPARRILERYLLILAATAVLLAIGMYLVGLRLVRRIERLNRTMDATLSDAAGEGPPPAARRHGDELDRLLAAFEDLQRRLDESRRRLIAQQQLATTGMLASSIAHEVRNPLQAIKLTLEMLRAQQSSPPADGREAGAADEGYELVLSEIDRLGLLADELLVLAGKAPRRGGPVDLAAELRATVRLLKFQFRQRDIRCRIGLPALPAVMMDPGRCRPLLLNLLLNAAEASRRGGEIRVEGSAGGGTVTLRVADSGGGFPAEVLDGRAREFFSTKTSGAGLGLSICRRIVAEADGRLGLYNTEAGAVAEVTLPAAGEAAEGP